MTRQEHSDGAPTRSRWSYVAVLGSTLATWAALVPATYARNDWIFSWDSAAFLETAQSILAGRGMQQRVIHELGTAIWEPITWWPPGYSILIATLSWMTGLPVDASGLALAIGASAIAALVVAHFAYRTFEWPLALLLALLVVSMPAFLQIGTQYMSDSSYFVCAAASICCLIGWTREPHRVGLLAAAGFLAGGAWTIRYVGSALLLISCAFVALHLLWFRLSQVVRFSVIWGAGVACCFVPMAARNVYYFGKLNPYNMPPSMVSLKDIVKLFGTVLFGEMTTSRALASWLIDWSRLAVLSGLTVVLIALAVRYAWRKGLSESIHEFRIPLFLLGYVGVYSAAVIYAGATYLWGAPLDGRYLVQIYWAIWFAIGWLSLAVLRSFNWQPAAATRLVAAAFALILAVHLADRLNHFSQVPPERVDASSLVGDRTVAFLAEAVRPDQIVLSTRADLLRIHANVNARKIPPTWQYRFVSPISREQMRRLGDGGFLWGIVVEDVPGAARGEYDVLFKDIVQHPDQYPEWEPLDLGGPSKVFRYRGANETTLAAAGDRP